MKRVRIFLFNAIKCAENLPVKFTISASFEKLIKNDKNNCTAAQKQQISNTLYTYKSEAVEDILVCYIIFQYS